MFNPFPWANCFCHVINFDFTRWESIADKIYNMACDYRCEASTRQASTSSNRSRIAECVAKLLPILRFREGRFNSSFFILRVITKNPNLNSYKFFRYTTEVFYMGYDSGVYNAQRPGLPVPLWSIRALLFYLYKVDVELDLWKKNSGNNWIIIVFR